ncbi:MAG: hypothetical protein QM744_18185 [Mesorhizobium sp.]
MVLLADQAEFIIKQWFERTFLINLRKSGNCQIDLSTKQTSAQICGVAINNRDSDLWVLSREISQNIRQKVHGNRSEASHRYASMFQVAHRSDPVKCRVYFFQDEFHARQKMLPQSGKLQRSGRAVKQRHSNQTLELRYGLADRRLRKMQDFGRTRKASSARNFGKGVHLAKCRIDDHNL